MTKNGQLHDDAAAPARVLVVDDEEDIRDLVAFHLRAAGMEVLTAGGGFEAVERARRERPDLVILDLMLPELDGISACEMLRRLPETATTPVIMLTAWATDCARLAGLQAGADDYLTKPFSPRDLVQRVQSRLRGPVPARRTAPDRTFTKVVLDLETRRVTVDGREVEVDARNYHLLTVILEALLGHPDRMPLPASKP